MTDSASPTPLTASTLPSSGSRRSVEERTPKAPWPSVSGPTGGGQLRAVLTGLPRLGTDLAFNQGAEDLVTRFGRLQPGFERGVVADLTDDDHVRVFPHRGTDCFIEAVNVRADLALFDRRLLRRVDKFDRVLRGQDMAGAVLVDLIHQAVDRGRLTASGRSGYKD